MQLLLLLCPREPDPRPSGVQLRVPDPSELFRVKFVLRGMPLAALPRVDLLPVLSLALALLSGASRIGRNIRRILVESLPPKASREGLYWVQAKPGPNFHQTHVRQVPPLGVSGGHDLVIAEPHAPVEVRERKHVVEEGL